MSDDLFRSKTPIKEEAPANPQIYFRISAAEWEALAKEANRLDCSITSLVKLCIREHFQETKE